MPRLASIQNGYSLLDRYFELGLPKLRCEGGPRVIPRRRQVC
ncbi:MAG: hypothetical protein R3E09_00475 [Novosphingobium sp.]